MRKAISLLLIIFLTSTLNAIEIDDSDWASLQVHWASYTNAMQNQVQLAELQTTNVTLMLQDSRKQNNWLKIENAFLKIIIAVFTGLAIYQTTQ